MITLHTYTVTVEVTKEIGELGARIENRISSMDGVTDVKATAVGQPRQTARTVLPAHLARAAEAVGAALSPDSIEQGEPA